MNKIIALFITFGFLITSCNKKNESKFEYKEWHKSPNRSPLSSTIYPYLEWNDVINITSGLTQENAKFGFHYYHHSINAIVFTKSPQNENYEIALKLSDNKNKVIDISYLKLDSIIK